MIVPPLLQDAQSGDRYSVPMLKDALLMVDTLALGVLEFDAGVTVAFEILGALVEFAFEASTSCIQHIKSNTNCRR